MAQSKKGAGEDRIIEEFIRDLEDTAEQVNDLLLEIRESQLEFAQTKTELKYLLENVKELSYIIREGNGSGSVLTRLAILEKLAIDAEEYIKKDSDSGVDLATRVTLLENNMKNDQTKTSGKWKLYATIAGGVFTLISSILALIMSCFH